MSDGSEYFREDAVSDADVLAAVPRFKVDEVDGELLIELTDPTEPLLASLHTIMEMLEEQLEGGARVRLRPNG